jgi:hypothetical protein
MATKLSIISNSLLILGHDVLTSLSDSGRVARIAINLYDDIKQDELTSSNWNFAKQKVQLAKLTTDPVDEFSSAYQLPSDLLKLLKITPRTNYRIYGDKLYTNESGVIFADYIANVGEETFPPTFSRMLSMALAADEAIPVREDFATSQLLEQRYIKRRNRAVQADSSQTPQDRIASNPFIAARQGS